MSNATPAIERPGEIVEVEWVDSFGSPHWVSPDDIPDLLSHLSARSVGYLASDTPEAIVIVMGVGGQDQHLNQMAIPRAAITSMTSLNPSKKSKRDE